MRALVCGGRNFSDKEFLFQELTKYSLTCIISGGASGADTLAYLYAKEHGIKNEIFHALWNFDGKVAGFTRNKRMLDEGKPDIVIAFPGGTGTAHMINYARAKNVHVILAKPAANSHPRP